MNIPKLIGPQIYGEPKSGERYISVNIDINQLRTSPFINFTGYAWVDQKFGFGMSLIKNSGRKVIIHDSDFLGLDSYAEILKAQKHTVCFVLQPKEWSVKNMRERGVFGGAPASNKRIRNAYNKLKSLGVSVKKFQNPLALERYLLKQSKPALKIVKGA